MGDVPSGDEVDQGHEPPQDEPLSPAPTAYRPEYGEALEEVRVPEPRPVRRTVLLGVQKVPLPRVDPSPATGTPR